PVERRDHLTRELETKESLFSEADPFGQRGVADDRRIRRRQAIRNERGDLLAPDRGSLVSTCHSPGHQRPAKERPLHPRRTLRKRALPGKRASKGSFTSERR